MFSVKSVLDVTAFQPLGNGQWKEEFTIKKLCFYII